MTLSRKNSVLSQAINVNNSAIGDTISIPEKNIVNISGVLTATSGNFDTLSINGTDVSVDGHTHNSIIIYSNSYDINALNISGINYTYIFNIGAENSSLILPTAINNKNIYTLKNNTNSSIYFKTSDSQTIDGYSPSPPPSGTVIGLNIRYSSITVVSDNNNWIIV